MHYTEKYTKNELESLVEVAAATLKSSYLKGRRTVTTAVLLKSGETRASLNLKFSGGFGVCAEASLLASTTDIALEQIKLLVTVGIRNENIKILEPCGNCRQMLAEILPNCSIIIEDKNYIRTVRAKDLLPFPYSD